jgi:hypothetical protein
MGASPSPGPSPTRGRGETRKVPLPFVSTGSWLVPGPPSLAPAGGEATSNRARPFVSTGSWLVPGPPLAPAGGEATSNRARPFVSTGSWLVPGPPSLAHARRGRGDQQPGTTVRIHRVMARSGSPLPRSAGEGPGEGDAHPSEPTKTFRTGYA